MTRAKISGAWRLRAIECSMREAAYRPELPADRIEVRMTAFMTAAAAPMPMRANTSVKGDCAMLFAESSAALSRLGSVYGSSVPMTAMAPI